jgi:hypothetical protein
MLIAAIAANACFIAGYIFYIKQSLLLNPGALAQAVYPAPLIIYALLFVFSLLERAATKEKIIICLARLSPALSAFCLLFVTPVFVQLNLPSPHNFTLRKLELMLGISYTAYIFSMAGLLVWRIKNTVKTGKLKEKGVFLYLLALFFVFNISLSLWFGYANEPTGDEPVYLLVTHSMLYDRDMDLRNNYENRDYKGFYSRDLQPQGDNLNVNGKMYPKHPAMFSAIIAPFYLIGRAAGVSVFMCALSALLAALMFYMAFKINNSMEAALAVSLLAGFTVPVFLYVNLVSTDILCAVIMTASFALCRFKPEKVLLFSFIMAAAVWVHIRIVPIYAVIALLFLFKHRSKPYDILKFGLVQALSFAAFFTFNLVFYRDFIPYASLQTSQMKFGEIFFKGLFAYFFDRQIGLFSCAPFYIICFPGMYFLFKKSPKIAVELVLVFVPYYLIIALSECWGCGNASPRYLLPVLFVPVAAAAATIAEIKQKVSKNAVFLLSAASLLIGFVFAAVPWFRWDRTGHDSWLVYLLSKFTGFNFSAIFPSFMNTDGHTTYALAFWVLFAAAITAIIIFGEKNRISTPQKKT